MSKRIGFVSLKGGVGKTSLAVHLAFYLHEAGKEVALVDGDPIESCHRWSATGAGFPFSVLYPGDRWPAGWLVFDTEAHPEQADLRALGDTLDLVVIPTTPNMDAIDAALMTAPALRTGKVKVRAIVNRAPPAHLPDGENTRAALEENGLETCGAILHAYKAYEFARLAGTSVKDAGHAGSMRAWEEFQTFAEEVLHGL